MTCPADADSVTATSIGRMRIEDLELRAQGVEIDLIRMKESVGAYWSMGQRGILPAEL